MQGLDVLTRAVIAVGRPCSGRARKLHRTRLPGKEIGYSRRERKRRMRREEKGGLVGRVWV